MTDAPLTFDVALPPLDLESGPRVSPHVARVWTWGPRSDALADGPGRVRAIASGAPSAPVVIHRGPAIGPSATPAIDVPIVLVVHALTGDAVVGGEGGWWSGLVGPGCSIDPRHMQVICVNNLGSCYGSSGPLDPGFPRRGDAPRLATSPDRGAFAPVPDEAPATLTTRDQARAIDQVLAALGVDTVALLVGGSIGGMIALELERESRVWFQRVVPVAAGLAATPWIIGFNHIARRVLIEAAPDRVDRALELARQLAHMTYRAEIGLAERQGRDQVDGGWHPDAPYKVQTYLEYQGEKLRRRFDPTAYLCQLDAMDHHDVDRPSASARVRPRGSVLSIGIDSDRLFAVADARTIVDRARDEGRTATWHQLTSPHGHDAFLIEMDQMADALDHALALPPGPPPVLP